MVAIGTFDGVHVGHQAVVRQAIERAEEMGLTSMVMTFEPQPIAVLRPELRPGVLTHIALKSQLIERLGVDELLVVPFTQAFARIRAERFAEMLVAPPLSADTVVVGSNFRFGHGGTGTVEMLTQFGRSRALKVESPGIVVSDDGKPISSTRIRRLVATGQVAAVIPLLGRLHSVEGVVVGGDGRGRGMGLPTANLEIPADAALPSRGVYAARAVLASGRSAAAVNIGVAPTFASERSPAAAPGGLPARPRGRRLLRPDDAGGLHRAPARREALRVGRRPDGPGHAGHRPHARARRPAPERLAGAAGAVSGGVLVGAGALRARLDGGDPPTLLDVRWALGDDRGRERHAEGHVPGAVYVDLDTELTDPPSTARGRHPLPSPARLQDAARRWGVRAGHDVVAYDDSGGLAAARAWWLLRWAGVSRVRLLDGGLAAWARAGGALESGDVAPEGGDIVLGSDGMPVVEADAAAALAVTGVLLDARAAERYRGEVEPVDPRAGHIPGARSAPTTGNLDPEGRFLAPEDLRARFATLGADDGRSVAVYCGSGVTAAHEVAALAVAGIEAALYPGSWSQWSGDPARPAATGDRPG